ncbi:xanthine dehydrogenase/oxidase-like [Haliotis cracherodii]|uniref:xanthine dehydrogenase/oxidase-like n=1 Tax=Haliotis cracherodii TaxID=6455 RepID=UPI0039ED686F
MAGADTLIFFVNGRKIEEKDPEPLTSLLDYLRYTLRLTGSKAGCKEGGCGACTVMVSEYDKTSEKIRHYSANACILPLCCLHGMAVTTVEGIGSIKTRLHPVQERIAEAHGSQCGFCTPGMVMSMYALLRNNPQPTEDQIRTFLDGNLCRCTGYRPILDGFNTFSKGVCGKGEECCRNSIYNNVAIGPVSAQCTTATKGTYHPPYDQTQEPIFPPELKNNWSKYQETPLVFKNERVTWYRPTTLTELLDLKTRHPGSKIIRGNTEIAIETRFKGQSYPVQIDVTKVPELNQITKAPSGITFGSAVTLTEIKDTLETAVKDMPEATTRVFRGFLDVIRWFASTQIRNVASIAGNIMTASPVSDLNPLLMAAGATVKVTRKGGAVRGMKVDSNFFTKYRTTCLAPEDVLLSVEIPASNKNEFFQSFKQGPRKEDSISIVNAGMRVVFEKDSDIIKEIHLVYGGMAPTTIMATRTMTSLVGSRWQNDLVTKATSLLAEELQLEPGVPGGMCEYRQSLTTSFFFKFYLSVQLALCHQIGVSKTKVPMSYRSAVPDINCPHPTTSHVYDDVSSGQPPDDTVGRSLLHESGLQHATGEAVYLDDMAAREGELFMALVLSERPHARLVSVDATEALTLSGVVDFITHKDIPGETTWGQPGSEEEVLASDKVLCRGQTIGAIVAESRRVAEHAATKVKVIYEDLKPIFTIQEAIENVSFHGAPQTLTSGDPESAFNTCDHVLEGEARTGAQEHFYLETMGSLVIPGVEDGKMEVYTGTQNPTLTQDTICRTLALTSNNVVVKVKRTGGAFGGKQSRNLLSALPAAVAAHKLGRPVRCVLGRQVDMATTGTRNPTWAHYKVGFNNDGKIIAYTVNVFANGGMSVSQSRAVVSKIIFQIDGMYNIPNMICIGHSCKTNLPSTTAFRGFGVPQATLITEQMIQHVADILQMAPEQIRVLNMYNVGDVTHFEQELSSCSGRRCWDECLTNSQFEKRRREVDVFNSENRWKKRGLSMVPAKFSACFAATAKQLNQASALVHIYLDGSVLIAHGGVEMGQGIHTKMIQVASRELRISPSFIHVEACSTDKINNASLSAGSATADINGVAVQDACHQLFNRLKPYMKPKGTWKEWVNAAYMDRVQLMATGFFKMDGLHYNATSYNNVMYNYFVYGAACSEVEIDCLTGEHHMIRSDLVVDAGDSLNPTVDIGQIEGAFIQGYGLYVLEDYQVSPDGVLLTQGPGTYKIPSIGNIPSQMNVQLLRDSHNKYAIYGSKGVGEASYGLALSVFFAIADAVKSSRADAGCPDRFQLDCPATPETVRMACQDQFTKKVKPTPEGDFKPWTVRLS